MLVRAEEDRKIMLARRRQGLAKLWTSQLHSGEARMYLDGPVAEGAQPLHLAGDGIRVSGVEPGDRHETTVPAAFLNESFVRIFLDAPDPDGRGAQVSCAL